MGKITWNMIYRDFRKTYPNLKKHVLYWCPHSPDRILLYMDDGSKWTYDHNHKKGERLEERWG